MLNFSIRPARAEDDARLGELLVRSFNETYAKKMPEVAMTERRRSDLLNVARRRELGHVLVLEVERQGRPWIAGTVTLFPPGSSASLAWIPGYADMRQLALDPECQGQGLADPLVVAAEAAARELGAIGMSLHVRRGAHGVARFYLRHGYERRPEGDVDKLPEVFLEAHAKPLDASADC